MSFQTTSFQSDAFQMDRYSGGYGAKLDSEAYAYVYNNADYLRTRQRVDSLPEPVREAVLEVAEIDKSAEREQALNDKLKAVDAKFREQYVALMELYYSALLEAKLAEEYRRIEQNNVAIMLLLL